MGAHSGKYGVLNGQSTVRNWGITDTQAAQKYIASNTLGGAGRIEGVHDWTGSFAQYGHTPLVMPGESFSFLGYTAPDSDVLAGVGTRYSGTALVDSVVINWNWGSGEILNTVINFGGHGVLTAADAAAAITDVSTIAVPPVSLGRIDFNNAEAGWTTWADIVTASLTITAENQIVVNSSTAGWTQRKAGNIDWTLALSEQNTQRKQTDFPDKGDDLDLRLYVDGSDYWHLKWGHVRDFSGIQVDRESGAILARTVNLDMNGFLSSVTGAIRKPGAGSDWWPA